MTANPRYRVVLVTTHYPPLVGGAATYFSLLAQTLSSRGVDVLVLTTRQPDLPSVQYNAVDVWRVIPNLQDAPRAVRQYVQAASTLIALMVLKLRGRCRIAHVHGSKSVTVGTAVFSVLSRTPVVYDIQDFFSRTVVIRLGVHRRYTAAGNPISEHLVSHGIPRDRVLVLPSIPKDSARAPVFARTEGGPCRCLFVGEVNHAIKGTDLLLQAFQRVHETEPTALLEIVGDGPDRDQDEMFVRRRRLDDVVRFTGIIPADRVLETIDKADIVVMASRTEGMPRIILEAFARGVPVVAPRVGGIPEVVRDGTTGVLVEPEDPVALAEGLLKLITDRAQRRRFGACARAWVDELPTWVGLAEQIESVYASAVAGN